MLRQSQIGLECSDLAMKAFSESSDLIKAEQNLKFIFEEELSEIECLAWQIPKELEIEYRGIDSSFLVDCRILEI